MKRRGLTWAWVCGLLAICGGALGADEPLEIFPDTTSIVIRGKTPEKTFGKVVDFVKQANADWAQVVEKLQPGLGIAISNPGLTGVDGNRDWWVAVFLAKEKEPGVLFAIPATKPDEMQEALTGSFETITQGKWLLYTEDADLAEQIKGRTSASDAATSLSKVIDAESMKILNGADVSAYVNVRQLLTVYQEQIDAAAEQAAESLENLQPPANVEVETNIDVTKVMGLYGGFLRGAVQTLKETEGFVVGLQVSPRGVSSEQYVRFAAGSEADKFLATSKPEDLDRLSKLPAKSVSYIGAHMDTDSLIEWSMNFAGDILKQDDEGKKALDELKAKLAEIQFGSFLASYNVGTAESGYLHMAGIIEGKPADKLRDLMRDSSKFSNISSGQGIKQEVEVQADAETFGKRTGDVIKITQTIDPSLDPMGTQQQMLQAMYGPEGLTTRVVALDDAIVETVGGGREAMESLLKAVDARATDSSVAGGDAAFKATRAALSDSANLVVLVDLPGIAASVIQGIAATGLFPLPLDPAALESASTDRTYFGFSFAAEPQAVRVKSHFPVGQLQGISKLVGLFEGLTGGPGQPGAF